MIGAADYAAVARRLETARLDYLRPKAGQEYYVRLLEAQTRYDAVVKDLLRAGVDPERGGSLPPAAANAAPTAGQPSASSSAVRDADGQLKPAARRAAMQDATP